MAFQCVEVSRNDIRCQAPALRETLHAMHFTMLAAMQFVDQLLVSKVCARLVVLLLVVAITLPVLGSLRASHGIPAADTGEHLPQKCSKARVRCLHVSRHNNRAWKKTSRGCHGEGMSWQLLAAVNTSTLCR